MSSKPSKVELRFFRQQSGQEPVREWLQRLDSADRKILGQDLMRVQWRWPVGMPLCRPIDNGLWEVQSSLPKGRIARVIFWFHSGFLVALHGFIKKTPKTPKQDLDLAHKRLKELDQ